MATWTDLLCCRRQEAAPIIRRPVVELEDADPPAHVEPQKSALTLVHDWNNRKKASLKYQGDYVTDQIIDEIEDAASMLEGECKKIPKTGIATGLRAQDRYIAVVCGPMGQARMSTTSVPADEEEEGQERLRAWRRGRLAYWECEDSFKKGETPRGFVDLMAISKARSENADVILTHRQDGQKSDLSFRFPNQTAAETWKENIRTLRKALDRTVMHV
mmetsp:Transcript_49336/g.104954  ORF Transcript_49336/g.104954 Transcript_49336/m.104954 type:complete len:217 (-) Transcript_49336:24-674(-)